MEKLKPGDRVWVKSPSLDAERKIGTIMATKKTERGVRYLIEWEVDLEDWKKPRTIIPDTSLQK